MQIIETLSTLVNSPEFIATLVRILILLVLFVVSWVLRKRIGQLLVTPIRALVNKTATDKDDFIARAMDQVNTYIVLSIPLFVSMVILPLSTTESDIILALAMTLVGVAFFRLIFDITAYLLTSTARLKRFTGYELDAALMPLVTFCAKAIVVILGVLTITQIWGWNIAGLVAGVGLGGLAVSLAAKDILDDIMGYGVIVADNVLREQEFIVSPHGEGIVENIGVLSTRIRQLNQGLVIVPNSKLSDDWVVNWSRLEKRCFNFVVGLTYGSTAEQIQEFVTTLTERLQARDHVQEDTVVVLFTEYADSSLNILVRFYVDLPDWVDAHVEQHQVNLMIMDTLNEIGLEVAFPSRSLYMENIPDSMTNMMTDTAHPKNGEQSPASNGHHQKRTGQSAYSQGDDAPEIAEKSMETAGE